MAAFESRVLALTAMVLWVGVSSASAQGSEGQRPQDETRRLQSLSAQADQPNAMGTELVIALGEKGANDSRFASFDAPFSLKNHFCGVAITDKTVCDATIDAASVTFSYDGPQDKFVAIRIDGRDEQLLTSSAGRNVLTLTLPLTELRVAAGKDRRIDILIKVNAKAVHAISLTFGDWPQLTAYRYVRSGTDDLAFVRLDRTGVATSDFLNPRWPIYLNPDPEGSVKRYLLFVNRLSDRQFIVTFSGISSDSRWTLLNADLHLSRCEGGKCNAVLVVPPGGARRVPLELLKAAYVKDDATTSRIAKVVTFDVVVFHEETQLANPRGYFSLVQFERLEQEAGGTAWTASVTGAYGFEPDMSDRRAKPDAPVVISDTATRGRGNDHYFKGTVSVGVKQSLGGRANSEVELRLKSGAYGTKASIEPTKYRLNVFGIQGNTYSAGLFTVAEPSEGIAISMSGENAGAHFGFLDINHIWRKYVPKLQQTLLEYEAKPADGDHSATLVQIKGAPGLTWPKGQLDLFGLAGRKHITRCEELTAAETCPGKPAVTPPANPDSFKIKQWYLTAGGELTIRPWPGWGTTLALFTSRLNLRGNEAEPYRSATHLRTDQGEGTVGMLTVSWTRLNREHLQNDFDIPARFTIRAQAGAGTGAARDDARNQAYLGETAGFAPDLLFLSVLAPVLQTERGLVGGGMANKRYMSIQYTSSQYSPLQWIAKAIRIPSNDIDGQSTTIRLHDYRFRKWNPGIGKHAGTELNMVFALDSPSKVTYSLSLAGFWPGSALTEPLSTLPGTDALIRGFQYSAIGKVTVKM